MKILYGVVGEGMGHAIRSRVVLEHLFRDGHEVEIMASSRAAHFLSKRFREVHVIHGLHIIYEDNRVKRGRTLFSNVRDGVAAIPSQIAAYFEMVSDFEPDVVVSDFESWTYYYAKMHDLPIISVDNMQIINRCTHDDEILKGERRSFEITRAFIKSKLPFCDHYLIGTFFYPPVRKGGTTLVPPILRPEVLSATRTSGEHLLVYQTAEGHDTLAEALGRTGLECRVYGMRRDLEADVAEGALTHRPFNERTFIEDLASCRGVIAGGGFTLMSECVYLGKPLFAVPVRGQFEQILNGRYLEREGFGMTAKAADAASVARFVERIEACAERLKTYRQDGNALMFATLDHQLDRAAAGL